MDIKGDTPFRKLLPAYYELGIVSILQIVSHVKICVNKDNMTEYRY